MADFRVIPSIESLRQRPKVLALQERYGHAAVVAALREATDALRRRVASSADRAGMTAAPAGSGAALPASLDEAAALIEAALEPRLIQFFQSTLRPITNATGVIIHTNLGRAPLSPSALAQVEAVSRGYSTLEFDLEEGGRGHRDRHAEALLCRLTGAEAAAVVNNNAAATMLMLAALGAGREVIVSRGELVEIGGGFRVPDVMAQSGAILREVGTTNRTRAEDYDSAITDRTALILRVHRSNFTIEGFTEQPTIEALVAVGRRHHIPVVEDLGSGNLIGGMLNAAGGTGAALAELPWLQPFLRDEPTVQGSVAAGVDVLCVSGDKLLGGPQAGIILGRRALVEKIRRHPLMRALRVDKMTYAALTGTLADYAAGTALDTIPVLRMLTRTPEAIEARAGRLGDRLASSGTYQCEVIDGRSTIGGGTTPGLTIPTRLLALTHRHLSADSLAAALRGLDLPIIARIEHDRVVLDLRTVVEEDDEAVSAGLVRLG
jgi:L-seryl-tRNA(Ser) seleniumtransferase